MAKLATIYGGSGFLGRHVAQILAQDGWRLRIAVRRPDEALFTRTYGVVGQIAPVLCNLRDEMSVRAAMADADAVINCTNITTQRGKSTFEAVLAQGAGRIARLSAEMGVARIVHVSGIGTDPDSKSLYVAAKARGEAAVLKHRPDAVIIRPSVIFGPGDSFYTKLASMTRRGPILPMAGGDTRVQPVHVDDVAFAVAEAARRAVPPGIYPLGGPEVLTMREVMTQTLQTVDRRRIVVNLPFWLARIAAGTLDTVHFLTAGLVPNTVLTRDQLALLAGDNVVAPGGAVTSADAASRHAPRPDAAPGMTTAESAGQGAAAAGVVVAENATGFEPFGIRPTAPQAILDQYLWPFRPSGQYEAIKASAKSLRQP